MDLQETPNRVTNSLITRVLPKMKREIDEPDPN